MAANKTTSKAKKDVKTKSKSTLKPGEEMSRWQVVKFVVGMIVLFASVYMLIAFTSYLNSGRQDFSMIDGCTDYGLLEKGFANVCGKWGALVAYFFINRCFGLASYLIPAFLILYGLKLIGSIRLKSVKLFILTGIVMVWASVFLASPMISGMPVVADSHVSAGGESGTTAADWIVSFLGQPGLYFVLLMTAIFILIYFSVRTVEIIRDILRMRHLRRLLSSVNKKLRSRTDSPAGNLTDEDYARAAGEGVVDLDTGEIIFGKNDDDDDNDNDDDNLNLDLDINDSADSSTGDDTAEGFDAVVRRSSKDQGGVSETLAGNEGGVEFEIEANQTDTLSKKEIENKREEESEIDMSVPYDPHKDLEFYQNPPLSLLEYREDANPQIDMDEQKANKDRIIQVLHSFGVEITSIKATVGPTITLYEITLTEGTRISKVRNLEDDIALSLAADGIRIIAPIPGKGTIGIEVPNKKKCVVSMESVISSKAFQETKMDLPCALGKTITNEVYMIDLAKAPHLLVAGATGMGKSVGLNAIVTSLLYKKHPSELKIVMVDPKKVEFSIYTPIENQFLAKLEEEEEPIITDVQKVVKTLNSLCQLMDTRYALLKKAGVRSIKEYNDKFKSRQLNPLHGHEYMPYYVVIIDEFGDLIMTAGKEIELPICRIAQMARAVGIHMIIATQRPTTQIITGTIKANFPARMAFKVSSMIDSRIILDRPGANQLVGRGDMLYLQGSEPVRVQCAFVDTPEVTRIAKYISTQQTYPHTTYLPEVALDGDGDGDGGADLGNLDPMFAECARLIVSKQMGSTSLLQRQFSIGYNKAGRIMDQMEKAGVVGPVNGAKPREVLIQDFNTLERLLNSLG